MVKPTVQVLRKARNDASFTLVRQLIFLACIVLAITARAEVSRTEADQLEQGRRIYQEGILGSGAKLKGIRFDKTTVEGEAATCAKCHRKSGMGSLEGRIVVPPVASPFLFPGENRPVALVDPRSSKNLTQPHDTYTDESLDKAIRKGINIQGAQMNLMMPRFSLGKSDMLALIKYLRHLSSELSPGVEPDTLRFATVITPGVEPKQRDALVEMMRLAFAQRNASQQPLSGRMRMGPALLPHTLRDWELKVWELQGAPETWESQLAENYRREPVFALVSGLSNTTWAPVHKFCQHEQLPCLFPSLTLPPTNEAFYSLYFSRGVTLEAEVLAKHLLDNKDQRPRRLLQVYRQDDAALGAAHALTHALSDSGIKVEDRVLSGTGSADLSSILAGTEEGDAVMFWLRPADLSALEKVVPSKLYLAYFSGQLAASGYDTIPVAWKSVVRLVYPYELGEKRRANLAPMQGWLTSRKLPIVDEAMQAEVFLNLILLDELAIEMLDNLYRDYMVERAEDMLSWGANISVYPHLSLAPGQRFASKGGYIVRFDGDKLLAESDWIVP